MKTTFGKIALQKFPIFNCFKEVSFRNRHTTKTILSLFCAIQFNWYRSIDSVYGSSCGGVV